MRRLTRPRTAHAAAAVLAVTMSMTSCSGTSDGDEPGTPAASPPAPTFAPGLEPAGGTSYAIGIPAEPEYAEQEPQTQAGGAVVRRWAHEVSPGGPQCTVVASEQPDYTGDFPDAVLQTFDALAEPGDEVIANDVDTAPPGAVAAVRQELVFDARLADGSTVPARLHQRQLLTAGGTLVTLTVAGPQEAIARCRSEDVLASLQLTGQTPPGGESSEAPA